MDEEKWNTYIMKEQILESSHGMNLQIRMNDIKMMSSVINFKNKSILDIGCENGSVLECLRKEYSCEINGCTLGKQYKKDFIKEGDMHELPYEDKKFDIVLIMYTMEHAISPYIVLCEINRVLKNDGIVIILQPEEGDIWTTTRQHYSVSTFRQLFNLLNKTGFVPYENYRKEYLINMREVKRDIICMWKKNTDNISKYEEKQKIPLPIKGPILINTTKLILTSILVYYITPGDEYNTDYLGRTDSLE